MRFQLNDTHAAVSIGDLAAGMFLEGEEGQEKKIAWLKKVLPSIGNHYHYHVPSSTFMINAVLWPQRNLLQMI